MTTTSTPTRPGARRTGLPLRVLGAVALGVSAVVHLRLALDRPPLVGDGQLTLSGLFLAQGVAAALASLWVLVRGDRPAWLVHGLVAAASLAAVLVGTYVDVTPPSFLPPLYEPVWYPDKVVSAVTAALATALAVVALLRLRGGRTTTASRADG